MPSSFSIRKLVRRLRDGNVDDSPLSETTASSSARRQENDSHELEPDTQATYVAAQKEPEPDKYGLFLLNKNTEGVARTYHVDVVAVHGLAGSAYKTWTHENGTLWLRDFLLEDLPGARVFTYGYNSAYLFSRETGKIREYAKALLVDIRNERKLREEMVRPLIFVCHSMGGIVVKQAIILAHNELDRYSEICNSVSGILFLGTPHQGVSSAVYGSILSQIANVFVVASQISRFSGPMRTELLQGLRANEEQLFCIAQDFRVHTGNIQIASFIEQKSIPRLNNRIVDERSGSIGVLTEELIPMPDCDHEQICKHGDRTSNYKKLLGVINAITSSATRNWESTAQINKFSPSGGSNQSIARFPRQINVPQKRVSYFISRQVLLDEIKDRLLNYPSSRTVVLYGMGGSGKTQLALEICQQAEKSLGFIAVIWIDASSPVSVSQSYGAIAEQISGKHWDNMNSAATISFVQDTLRDWEQPWLVVLDNYDNPDAFPDQSIRSYIPEGNNQHILLTSRHPDTEELGHLITVSEMSQDESLKLLLKGSPLNDEERMQGLEIARTLGYLALALHQTAAYIRARKLPLKDFIPEYKRRKEVILKEIPREWVYRKTIQERETTLSIFTTWELSFEQISGNDEERERKAHFLTLSAFFNNTLISERYFEAHFTTERPAWMGIFSANCEWDSDKLGDVLAELQRLSLLHILYGQSERQFSIHPVVCDWLKLRKSKILQQQFAAESIKVLTNYLSNVNRELLFELIQEATLHISACVQNDREVLKGSNLSLDNNPYSAYRFAGFCLDQGLYDEAENLYGQALAESKRILGLESPYTLRTMGNLAIVYRRKAKYGEAEKLYKQALAGFEKTLGSEHPDTLRTIEITASNYARTGQYGESEKLYKQALAGLEKSLGPQHPSTERVRANLAALNERKKQQIPAKVVLKGI